MPIYVQGLAELNRVFKKVTPDIYKDMRKEMLIAANLVASKAKDIAEAKGLRESGDLIEKIKPGATMRSATVADKALKKSPKYPSGFNYPAVYEYGGRGTGKTGPRAFLTPAIEESDEEIAALLERMVERVLERHNLP